MTFFLLDRITALEVKKSITAVKCWSLDNALFEYHFPSFPVVPGVILTESMAQMLGLLIERSYYAEYDSTKKVFPILSLIQKAKFKNFVRPGDKCILEGSLLTIDKHRGTGEAAVFVDGERMCEAALSFVIFSGEGQSPGLDTSKLEDYHRTILGGLT